MAEDGRLAAPSHADVPPSYPFFICELQETERMSAAYLSPLVTAAQVPRQNGLGDGYTWFSRGARELPYRRVLPMYERDVMVQPYSNVPATQAAYRQESVTLRTQQVVFDGRGYAAPAYVGPNYLY